MNKYYITFGDYQLLISSETPHKACMCAFKRSMANDSYRETIPKNFRISQIGFDKHDNDEYISTDIIIQLSILSQAPLPPE